MGLAAAVSGHIWPVWLKFSGGKGLAAGLGGLLWSGQHLAIAVFVIAWLLVYALRRQDDVASACGAIAVAILALSTGPLTWLAVLGAMIALKHFMSYHQYRQP